MHLAKSSGLEAYRVPLSGGAREKGDVVIEGMRFECKYRSKGLKFLYDMLEKAEEEGVMGIFLSGFRKPALAVLRCDVFLKLVFGGRECRNEGAEKVLSGD